ncbi:hypothetical protein MJO28_003654, partial [Puccinia striiformis f. sp. tritici]
MRRFSMRFKPSDDHIKFQPSDDDSESDDSEESFHCQGKPDELVQDPLTPRHKPSRPAYACRTREVLVSESPDFYGYQSGIERQKHAQSMLTEGLPPIAPLSFAPRNLGRTQSSDSDKTMVEEPLLVIKTKTPTSSPAKRMKSPSPIKKFKNISPKQRTSKNQFRHSLSQLPSPKPKSRRASLNIFRSPSFRRAPDENAAAAPGLSRNSPQKNSKPPRARFSLLQASRRFSKNLCDIKEVDRRATVQPQGSSKDLYLFTEEDTVM